MFRGKFLALLQRAFEQQELEFHGQLLELAHPKAWEGWLEPIRNKEWVVYAKPPFGGPEQVLKYLARYTHRVAISNRRIQSFEGGKVRFTWKDYASGNQKRTMTLSSVEFIRRFLLHVLPSGFMRIRYYGFLANRHRAEKVQLARMLLTDQSSSPENDPESPELAKPQPDAAGEQIDDFDTCPKCKKGRLVIFLRVGFFFVRESWSFDSS
jgi:hypothetical protein